MKNKIVKIKTAATTKIDNIHCLIREICADPELWGEVISGAVPWDAVRQRLAGIDADKRKKIADSICRYLKDIPDWGQETEGCVTGLMIDTMDEMGLMIMAAP